ncbi:MAG: hypothetical protein Kow0059_07710 [Candidatus Sumerlaeia bacterium]
MAYLLKVMISTVNPLLGGSLSGNLWRRVWDRVSAWFSIRKAMEQEFDPQLEPEPLVLPERQVNPAEPDDLKTLITNILLERERLAHLTNELMQARADNGEMERLMRKILPFLDSLERILYLGRSYPPTEEVTNWLTGLESLYFRMVNTLEKFGLIAVQAEGRPVDLDCQEVVEYVSTQDHPHNFVIKERQKGYLFRGKVLRDAKVVVANNPQRS